MTNRRQKLGLVFAVCLAASAAVADSLELNNGSLIKGTFMGGNQNTINFQVGSSMQSFSVGDIRALRFDCEPEGAGSLCLRMGSRTGRPLHKMLRSLPRT